jgi:hypothetical protein
LSASAKTNLAVLSLPDFVPEKNSREQQDRMSCGKRNGDALEALGVNWTLNLGA